MRVQTGLVLSLCLLACVGCSKQKSTDELITDLKSGTEDRRGYRARTLPRGRDDAARSFRALIEALTHMGQRRPPQFRLKLGEFHEQAKDAIPCSRSAGARR